MENETPEVEVVEEETSTAVARAPLAVTVTELAALDGKAGVARIEQLGEIINSLRVISLKLTMPSDWVLFKSPDGAVTGFLGDSGCDRIKKLWGIQVENLGTMERIEVDSNPGEFAFRITGDGNSRVTGESVFEMEGIRYSTEPYAQQKSEGIQRIVAVQKAARANLDGGITRELAGLKSIPVEELTAAWAGTWKKWEMCAKGKGFGSGAERQGAQVQQTSEIPHEFQPKCDTCHKPMKFIPAGTSQGGKPYPAFWACADRNHKGSVPHTQALAEAKTAQAAAEKREPGDEK